jgi:PAS domain S-box-containing protein
MNNSIKILIVDDSPDDAELLTLDLSKSDLMFSWKRVDSKDDLQLALSKEKWDVILCDIQMPYLTPEEVLEITREVGNNIPVIIISGVVQEESTIKLLESGARDFFAKDSLSRLPLAIHREILGYTSRCALIASEERFRQIANNIPQVLWMMSIDASVMHYVSPSYERIWQRSCQSLYDNPHSWMTSIHQDDVERVAANFAEMAHTGVFDDIYRILTPRGEIRWIHDHAVPILDKKGELHRITGFAEDITEQKQAEDEVKSSNERMLASEKQLSSILANTQAVIFLKDIKGRYLLVNKRYEELFHITEKEIVGKTDFDIFPVEMAQTFQKNDRDIIKSGKPQEIEEFVPHDDGIHTYIAVKFPLRNENGVIYGVCGISTDITQRRYAEESLLLSEERHRTLLEATTEIIWTTDAQGGFVKPQIPWEIFTGQPWEEHKNYGWVEMIHKDDREQVQDLWEKALESKSLYKSSGRVWNTTFGEYRFFVARAAPLFANDGKVLEWVGTINDITERKQFEDALLKAKQSAEAANNAKSEFLAVMSHEIRTPLNAILGMTEVAMEFNQDPDLSRFLEVIDRSGKNLLSLISDILDLSSIEAGRLTLEHKPVNLQELTQEALDIHSINAKNKWLDLTCQIDPATPKQFNSDQKRLRQVLLNLIGNAVKFTEQGKVELLVSCPSPHTIQFSVSDSGIGIPEEKQKLIFAPFSQADSSNTRQHGGVGLGLAICKRLVDAMDGQIWVESEPGKGSTFHFSVPLPAVEHSTEQPDIVDSDQREGIQETGDTSSILLAEDNPDNALVIEAYLKTAPFQLEIVKDGQQAVSRITAGNNYDLILMDIQMPVMDGLEATRQIRIWEKEQGIANTPILALTSHAMNGDEEKSLAAGCDSHITKPINKQKLLGLIDKFTKG